MPTTSVSCAAGCKRAVETDSDAIASGWSYLQITNRWRCPTCDRELREASAIVGMVDNGPVTDTLPPDSRGALPKATAGTITPPSVKG